MSSAGASSPGLSGLEGYASASAPRHMSRDRARVRAESPSGLLPSICGHRRGTGGSEDTRPTPPSSASRTRPATVTHDPNSRSTQRAGGKRSWRAPPRPRGRFAPPETPRNFAARRGAQESLHERCRVRRPRAGSDTLETEREVPPAGLRKQHFPTLFPKSLSEEKSFFSDTFGVRVCRSSPREGRDAPRGDGAEGRNAPRVSASRLGSPGSWERGRAKLPGPVTEGPPGNPPSERGPLRKLGSRSPKGNPEDSPAGRVRRKQRGRKLRGDQKGQVGFGRRERRARSGTGRGRAGVRGRGATLPAPRCSREGGRRPGQARAGGTHRGGRAAGGEG